MVSLFFDCSCDLCCWPLGQVALVKEILISMGFIWLKKVNVVKQINSYSAIVVFGLQVYGPDHIHPDQTLLGPTVWELSELTWRSSNIGVVWQRVHFKGALMVDKSA